MTSYRNIKTFVLIYLILLVLLKQLNSYETAKERRRGTADLQVTINLPFQAKDLLSLSDFFRPITTHNEQL